MRRIARATTSAAGRSTRASRGRRRAGSACRPGTRPAGRRRRRGRSGRSRAWARGRAARPAVDPGGQHGGEEPPVEPGVLGLDGPVAALEVLVHAHDARTSRPPRLAETRHHSGKCRPGDSGPEPGGRYDFTGPRPSVGRRFVGKVHHAEAWRSTGSEPLAACPDSWGRPAVASSPGRRIVRRRRRRGCLPGHHHPSRPLGRRRRRCHGPGGWVGGVRRRSCRPAARARRRPPGPRPAWSPALHGPAALVRSDLRHRLSAAYLRASWAARAGRALRPTSQLRTAFTNESVGVVTSLATSFPAS